MDFKWGEQDEEDEEKVAPAPTRPQSFVSGPDKDGIKTITEYRTDEATGKKLQVVRKVKETRVSTMMNKNVLARRQWKKFGKCAKLPPGPEPGATFTSHDNIQLQLKCKKREDDTTEEDDDPLRKLPKDSFVTCSHCGERGHWSLKCPKRDAIVVVQKARPNEEPPSRPESTGDSRRTGGGGGGDEGKYVPVHMRGKGDVRGSDNRKGGDAQQREEDSSNQIRVTNISEDTTENDLRELFRRFGTTSRIYLAKDKGTNQSRGFAFITYTSRADAQKAIDRLNGYGYGNLILHVEFAKPREEDGAKGQGGGGAGARPGWTMAGTK